MTNRGTETTAKLIVRVLRTSASMKSWVELATEKGWHVLTVEGRPYAEIHCK